MRSLGRGRQGEGWVGGGCALQTADMKRSNYVTEYMDIQHRSASGNLWWQKPTTSVCLNSKVVAQKNTKTRAAVRQLDCHTHMFPCREETSEACRTHRYKLHGRFMELERKRFNAG